MSEIPEYPENVTPTNRVRYLLKRKSGQEVSVDGGTAKDESELSHPGDGKVLSVNGIEVWSKVTGIAYTPHLSYTWTVTATET